MNGKTRGAIVVTTINEPTDAVRQLATLDGDWPLIVVGDNKTPSNFALDGARYISIEEQRASSSELASLLPENHYCRKNLGYIEAIASGVSAIAETDDDNRPYRWNLAEVSETIEGTLVSNGGWLNVYEYFTDERVWPRGFPLEKILEKTKVEGEEGSWIAPIQQFLAAGDPDVDAIYRLVNGKADHQYRSGCIVLDKGTMTPFNSQSTVWYSRAFLYMYLPSFVSFRMTDIWRSFVAQVCLWADGGRLAYHGDGVWQDRNPHDLSRDFADESVGYLRNSEIVDELRALSLNGRPQDNLRECYELLLSLGIVESREIELVEAWIGDVERATLEAAR